MSLEPQGTHSASYLRHEDAHIAAEKQTETLWAEWGSFIRETARAIDQLPACISRDAIIEAIIEDLDYDDLDTEYDFVRDGLTEWVKTPASKAEAA